MEMLWSENRGEIQETGRILGYSAVSSMGRVLASGEDPNEAIEKALLMAYLSESNASSRSKVKSMEYPQLTV